jgi:hypothetical protein
VRISVDFVQVFLPPAAGATVEDQDAVVAAMRDGFTRALVSYYPVVGRIPDASPEEPVVECTGQGVWFVEAAASCALADVPRASLLILKEELLPRPPPEDKLGSHRHGSGLIGRLPIPLSCCLIQQLGRLRNRADFY